MTYPRAEGYLKPVGRGTTLPQFFMVEGVGLCAVKFFRNPQGERALLNEWIAFKIADALELPHPNVGAVEIEALALPNAKLTDTDHWGERWEFEPGLAFYSQWLENTDAPVASDFDGLLVINPEVLAGAVVLDILVDNWDRAAGNPNLLLHRKDQRQYLYLVDYGMTFKSACWELGNLADPSLPPLDAPLPYSETLEGMFKKVNAARDFSGYLAKLTSLDRTFFQDVIDSIPLEWKVTDLERAALVDFLWERAQAIPDYMNERLQKEVWW